jgi:predicted nucleotidyltransferase
MKPSEALEKHRHDIRRLTHSRRATNPRVFGSAARGEDVEGSDLDILVDTVPGTTLFDLGGLFEDLRATLGVPVDIVTIRELPPEIREQVLAEAQPI